jgi:hypothetical protein
MSLPDIREQIKVILSGISGIGIVHDYDRFSKQWDKFLNLFQDETGKINGITFRREKSLRSQQDFGEEENLDIFVFRVIMGLNDSEGTGIEFDDHLQNIMDTFNDPANEKLNGTCKTIIPYWGPMKGNIGMQLDLSEDRLFGNVLCHYGELRMSVISIFFLNEYMPDTKITEEGDQKITEENDIKILED